MPPLSNHCLLSRWTCPKGEITSTTYHPHFHFDHLRWLIHLTTKCLSEWRLCPSNVLFLTCSLVCCVQQLEQELAELKGPGKGQNDDAPEAETPRNSETVAQDSGQQQKILTKLSALDEKVAFWKKKLNECVWWTVCSFRLKTWKNNSLGAKSWAQFPREMGDNKTWAVSALGCLGHPPIPNWALAEVVFSSAQWASSSQLGIRTQNGLPRIRQSCS